VSGFTVRVEDEGIQDALARLSRKVGNLEPVFDDLGRAILTRVHQSFETETSPGGLAWTPLAPATIKARAKKNSWPGPILRVRGSRAGGLFGSILSQPEQTRVVIGVEGNAPHAAIHQFGGMAGRGRKVKIPARPYLLDEAGNIPDPWINACLDIIRDYIAETEA